MSNATPRDTSAKRFNKRQQNGRFVAVQTLVVLDQERGPVKALLEKLALRHHLPDLERGLAMQLVFGVLRHRQVLERMIALLSRTPPKKIDPFIFHALTVGLYQLFFLDRIPAPAAVHAMVEVCKTQRVPQRLEGFVNGILRQALREGDRLASQAQIGSDGTPLLNHPAWLVARWQERFGREETARICGCNNQEPRLVLRTNTTKMSRDQLLALMAEGGVAAEAGTYALEALTLPDYRGKISLLPGYREGYFLVQDEAAQLATTLLLPLRPKATYLDGCAGVGGKTSLLLQHALEGGQHIHALEPDGERLALLRENVRRLDLDNHLTIHHATLQNFADLTPISFDGILIDAPCSGTGVTGRHPDIRWNRQTEDFAAYAREQRQLLDCAARLLAPGGTLVYATCSLEPEENYEVVSAFLASHPLFILDDCSPYLPEAAQSLVIEGCFAPRPDTTIDGFFAARLRHR